jgi:hypothetical protein
MMIKTLQASEPLIFFSSTLKMPIAQENFSAQLNYLLSAVLSKQGTNFSIPRYIGSQVVFNKLLDPMKMK